jgi:hypothetical protein
MKQQRSNSNPDIQAQLDLKLNIADAESVALEPIQFYVYDEVGEVAGYNSLTDVPAAHSEYVDTVVVNNNTVLMDSYISPVLGITDIQAGTYIYKNYSSVSNATSVSRLQFKWYSYHIDTTKTLLYTHSTDEINSTSVTLVESYVTEATPKTILATDRLVLEIYGVTTRTTNTTISLVQGGTQRNSHIETPILKAVPSVVQAAIDAAIAEIVLTAPTTIVDTNSPYSIANLEFIKVNSTAAIISVVLPSTGKVRVKWTAGVNAVTLTVTGGGTIDGAASYEIQTLQDSIDLEATSAGVWSIV